MSKDYSWNIQKLINYIIIPIPKKIFESYLSKVFSSIIQIEEENKSEGGLSIISFTHYLNLPLFLSEKIFHSIKKCFKNKLNKREFIIFFLKLYYGTLEERLKLFFDILDFDKDNIIRFEDVQLFSYHMQLYKNIYKDDVDLDLINNIIFGMFEMDNLELNYNEFIKNIKFKNSDIFFLYIMFFYKYKPFSINELKLFEKHFHSEKENKEEDNNLIYYNIFPIQKPTRNLFIYLKKYLNIEYQFIDLNMNEDEEILNELNIFENDFHNIKNQFNLSKEKQTSVISASKYSVSNLVKEINDLNNIFFKEKSKTSSNQYLFKAECEIGIREKKKDFEKDNIPYKNAILYLCNNSLFVFYNKYKNLDLYILKKVLEIEKIDNLILICLIIGLNPKVIEINFNNEKNRIKFLNILIKTVNYRKIKDYYDINSKIGKGGFGKIFMGINKKTKKKVAIKQIEKQYSIPFEEQSYFFWELSINKTIKNIEAPYFIKIYDIFESFSHIYIVMEYAEDDFQNYLKTNWPDIDTIYDFVKQIANGILTLNKFGIMHRDLKIDNIILSYDNNNINDETNYQLKPNIKLIDFGLSKIIGYYESTNETYGTLFYISPEIIHKKDYNYKEDVWSFGVICYFLLNKKMPFLDLNEDFLNYSKTRKVNIVTKNIEERDVSLNEDDYEEKKEKILAQVINMSLIKNIEKRAWISDIVNLLNQV